MENIKLSPMRAFALNLLAVKQLGTIEPWELRHEWREATGGRWKVASRDDFGNTSAAYKTLYWLESKGLIRKDENVEDYRYSLTPAGAALISSTNPTTF